MKRRLFVSLAGAALAAAVFLALSGCDNFNVPVKEKIDFYRAITPVNDWDALKKAVEETDAELIALTKSFPTGSAAIAVTRPVTISAVPEAAAVITRSASFTEPFFEVKDGGVLTLGHPTGGTLVLDGNKDAFPAGTSSLIEMPEGGASLVLAGAELKNNRKSGDGHGGAVSVVNSSGTVIIRMYEGIIEGNIAELDPPDAGNGGGLSLRPGGSGNAVFEMYGGIIRGNSGSGLGGGVFIDSAVFTLYGGTISGNTAGIGGGGVCGGYGSFIMEGGTIRGNRTSLSGGQGGGVSSNGGFIMNNGTIEWNEAESGGGVSGSALTINNGIIRWNTAVTGGGVFTMRINMHGGVISGNTATGNGGGIAINNSPSIIDGGIIAENTAGAYGGGVYLEGGLEYSYTLTFSGGTISGNKASEGGGIYLDSYYQPVILTMYGGTISGNKAGEGGGGICLYSEYATVTLTMNGGTIAGNTAGTYGGGVYGYGLYGTSEFIKKPAAGETASGIIYGNDAGADSNGFSDASGNPVDGTGHAVYVTGSPDKKRDSTAGENDELDSSDAENGGWEP